MSYSVNFRVDDVLKRVYIVASGDLSTGYIDDCIEFYKSLPDAWFYQKLVDTRGATVSPHYEDIVRMTRYFASLHRKGASGRVARLVSSTADLARASSLKILFDTDNVMTFLDEREALAWLDTPAA